MKLIKYLLPLLMFMVVQFASAQKPGYQIYRSIGSVNNGVRSNGGGGTVYIKFDGNLAFEDFGLSTTLRYIYSGQQSDGTLLYYQQAWNYGTITQGSGWVTTYNSWMKVSPDKKTINTSADNGKLIIIYQIQTPDSAGEMIY